MKNKKLSVVTTSRLLHYQYYTKIVNKVRCFAKKSQKLLFFRFFS